MSRSDLRQLAFGRSAPQHNEVLVAQAVREQAHMLGMDPDSEPHLMWIAKESLFAPPPEGWVKQRTERGELYYLNERTGQSQWEHPSDEYYRQVYLREKARVPSAWGVAESSEVSPPAPRYSRVHSFTPNYEQPSARGDVRRDPHASTSPRGTDELHRMLRDEKDRVKALEQRRGDWQALVEDVQRILHDAQSSGAEPLRTALHELIGDTDEAKEALEMDQETIKRLKRDIKKEKERRKELTDIVNNNVFETDQLQREIDRLHEQLQRVREDQHLQGSGHCP